MTQITETIDRMQEAFHHHRARPWEYSVNHDDAKLLIRTAKDLSLALRYVIKVRQIKCEHKHPAPDPICAKCVAEAALEGSLTDDQRDVIA